MTPCQLLLLGLSHRVDLVPLDHLDRHRPTSHELLADEQGEPDTSEPRFQANRYASTLVRGSEGIW